MTTYMTRVDYTDADAKVPGSDDGIGAWVPLNDHQRRGESRLDCDSIVLGSTSRRVIGSCDDGPVRVCLACFIRRLRDHIDYYRPQSSPSCCDHHAGWADAPACDDGESDGLFDEES